MENDECTTDPKQIMSEIHNFYANLYHTDSRERGGLSTDEYLRNINTNMLTDEQRELLDNKITTSEYFEALKSFQKNKTPGNDGLTGILSRLLASRREMPCRCFKLRSRKGTTIQLAKTGYD